MDFYRFRIGGEFALSFPQKLSKLTGSNNLYLDSSVLCNRQIAYKNVAIREKLPLLLPSSTQNYNIVS